MHEMINDTEENICGLLDYCKEAKVYGIMLFDIGVTLREGDREYFYKQLDKHFPGMKEQYIRTYGNAYEIPSPNNKKLMKVVKDACARNGIVCDSTKLFCYMREFEDKATGKQITLEEHFNV